MNDKLSKRKFAILLYLAENKSTQDKPNSKTIISSEVGIHLSNVSPCVDELELQGFIKEADSVEVQGRKRPTFDISDKGLDYVLANRPDLFERIRRMHKTGNIQGMEYVLRLGKLGVVPSAKIDEIIADYHGMCFKAINYEAEEPTRMAEREAVKRNFDNKYLGEIFRYLGGHSNFKQIIEKDPVLRREFQKMAQGFDNNASILRNLSSQ